MLRLPEGRDQEFGRPVHRARQDECVAVSFCQSKRSLVSLYLKDNVNSAA
jgi:hypothetical protein